MLGRGRWAGGIYHPGTWMAIDWITEREKRCTENGLAEFGKLSIGGGVGIKPHFLFHAEMYFTEQTKSGG